ncbi:MAG: ATP-dependent DNA ligase, partial [Planctomycetota bacterium]|nr:ATP-dependent DNA ligase [Planctomycetota bacterium]
MNLSFAELFTQLDQTTKTNVKIEAMARYFALADPSSAAWEIYFLTGRPLKRLVSTRLLRNWAAE